MDGLFCLHQLRWLLLLLSENKRYNAETVAIVVWTQRSITCHRELSTFSDVGDGLGRIDLDRSSS